MEWLNYHHLRYFWTVASMGSISKASKELRVSSPAISAQLRSLEENLGEKLFVRSGRNLILTEVGRVVFSYSGEIFALGRELTQTVKNQPAGRPLRLVVGVVDALPKMIAQWLIAPALSLRQSVRIVCREGSSEQLTSQLARHELDVVLSDVACPPNAGARVYNHLLGECGVTFVATPALARGLKNDFPRSLDGAPMLLPVENTGSAEISTIGSIPKAFDRRLRASSRTMPCSGPSARPASEYSPSPRSSKSRSRDKAVSGGLAAPRMSAIASMLSPWKESLSTRRFWPFAIRPASCLPEVEEAWVGLSGQSLPAARLRCRAVHSEISRSLTAHCAVEKAVPLPTQAKTRLEWATRGQKQINFSACKGAPAQHHCPWLSLVGGPKPQRPRMPCRNRSRSSGVMCSQRSAMRRRKLERRKPWRSESAEQDPAQRQNSERLPESNLAPAEERRQQPVPQLHARFRRRWR